MKTIHPHPSLTWRIRQFFAENPDEELTLSDLREKFGCKPSTASMAVLRLARQGFVENVRVVRRPSRGVAK